MKIKNIACEQFAGVMDKNIALSDGINVIFGENESGKSTLVDLVSRVLFQNSKLNGSQKADKSFKEKYFPTAVKGSNILSDCADGEVVFNIDGDEYKLSKVWGDNYSVKLRTPSGMLRDENKINEIIKDKLVYGEGVYNGIMLSSQHSDDKSLQIILSNELKEKDEKVKKQDIVDALSMAFVQSDGISVDAIENAILDKLNTLEGEHWDYNRKQPEPRNTKWVNKIGDIMRAYYKLDDAKKVLNTIDELQNRVDSASNDYNIYLDNVEKLEQNVTKFAGVKNLIELKQSYQKDKDLCVTKIDNYNKILATWIDLDGRIAKAKALQTELESRKYLDLYNKAKSIIDELDAMDSDVLNAKCPTDEEIFILKSNINKVLSLQNKLCGMNINANIKMFGNNNIMVKSLKTGEQIMLDSDNVVLNEAVKITVPNVLDMVLAPSDVDVDKVNSQIEKLNIDSHTILKKYNVEDVEKLEKLSKNINRVKSEQQICNQKLQAVLDSGNIEFTELENIVNSISGAVRSYSDIEKDIVSVCGTNNVQNYIVSKQTIIDGYVNDYESVDKLKVILADTKNSLQVVQEKLANSGQIPQELANISNPDSYIAMQQDNLERAKENMQQAFKIKTEASTKLEEYMSSHDANASENVDLAQREFDETCDLLDSWKNIYKKFLQIKNNITNNPMDDLASSFSKYLSVISNGRVETQFPYGDKLQMDIYSNNHILDYDILSEGTKDTIYLAFRLAIIDHLFPNGNSVVVFDDPFTDMDIERTQKACELIRECAKRNQVIVLTCKQEYADMLGGNLIKM